MYWNTIQYYFHFFRIFHVKNPKTNAFFVHNPFQFISNPNIYE